MSWNLSWQYNDLVVNIKMLKHSYEEVLTSFFDIRDENKFIKATRDVVYSLNLEEYQKDRIWEYFNGYLSPEQIFKYFGIMEDLENETSNKFINR